VAEERDRWLINEWVVKKRDGWLNRELGLGGLKREMDG
jgi:hypothetical protein